MWTTINQVYATPHTKNCHAHVASDNAWRKVKPISDDGVTNTHLLLALARANSKKAYVVKDGTNQITGVYL
jgi:hypothetical protein